MVFRLTSDGKNPGATALWCLMKDTSVAVLWTRRTARGADLCLAVDGRQQFTMSSTFEDVGLESLRLRNRLQDAGWHEAMPEG